MRTQKDWSDHVVHDFHEKNPTTQQKLTRCPMRWLAPFSSSVQGRESGWAGCGWQMEEGGGGSGGGRQTGSPSAAEAVGAALAGGGVATTSAQEVLVVVLAEEGVAHGLAQGVSWTHFVHKQLLHQVEQLLVILALRVLHIALKPAIHHVTHTHTQGNPTAKAGGGRGRGGGGGGK